MDSREIQIRATQIFKANRKRLLKITSVFLFIPVLFEIALIYLIFPELPLMFSLEYTGKGWWMAAGIFLFASTVTILGPVVVERVTTQIFDYEDWTSTIHKPVGKFRFITSSMIGLLYSLTVLLILNGVIWAGATILPSILPDSPDIMDASFSSFRYLAVILIIITITAISIVSTRLAFANQINALRTDGPLETFGPLSKYLAHMPFREPARVIDSLIESWKFTEGKFWKFNFVLLKVRLKTIFFVGLTIFLTLETMIPIAELINSPFLIIPVIFVMIFLTIIILYLYTEKLTFMTVMYYSFYKKDRSGMKFRIRL